jgi:hypothetical protein
MVSVKLTSKHGAEGGAGGEKGGAGGDAGGGEGPSLTMKLTNLDGLSLEMVS